MKTPAKVTILVLAGLIAVVIGAILIAVMNRPAAPEPEPSGSALPGTRTNTHILDEAGPDAPTLVEFLDFECEACGGLYPVIEQVREQYRGEEAAVYDTRHECPESARLHLRRPV